MMQIGTQPPGLAVWCDGRGTILEVLRDDFALGARLAPGQPLIALVDPSSQKKGLDFLDALRTQRAAFGWELDLPVGERLIAVQFAGGAMDERWCIVGVASSVSLSRLYDDLMRINNEQMNLHRQVVKQYLDLEAHYKRLQTTLASVHEAVVVTDAAGAVTFMNAPAQALTGWEAAVAQGKAAADVVRVVAGEDPEVLLSGAPGAAWPTDQPLDLAGHRLWRTSDNAATPIAGHVTPLRDATGTLLGSVWVFRDATADQELAAQLQAVHREQEVLVREVHHRVKNHFQTLASLLDLQADTIEDPRALAAIEDSQQRIQSMALVHQSLYQSGDVGRMDLAAYLRGLADELCRASGAEARHLTLRLTTEAVWLPVETAMPCGLILNELLANAFKHAFPVGRPGVITVTLRTDVDGTCVLEVCDDGVGFPDGLDFHQSESLGLRLVCLLTEQLGGTLDMRRGGGTHWTLTFPIPPAHGQGKDAAARPTPKC
jgi:PAS domain S-box-containing protein